MHELNIDYNSMVLVFKVIAINFYTLCGHWNEQRILSGSLDCQCLSDPATAPVPLTCNPI